MPFNSSPDPLSLSSGPFIAEPSRRSRSRSPSKPLRTPQPRSTSAVQVHSPTKMTATTNSHLSPWRIKVMVEAERDDGSGSDGSGDERGRMAPPSFTLGFAGEGMDVEVVPSPRQRKSRDRSVGVITRTRTTKVPVKGLDSSPSETMKPKGRRATPTAPRRLTPVVKSTAGTSPRKAAVTPKPATTPRWKRASLVKAKATAAEVDEEDDGEKHEASSLSADTTAVKTSASKSPGKRRKSRTPRTSLVPTLASTRSRRSSLAPVSYIEAPASTPRRSTRSASAMSNGERHALSGRDPNSVASPSPAKSNTPVASVQGSRISRRGESVASAGSNRPIGDNIANPAGESFLVSEGGSMALPEDRSGFLDDGTDLTAQFGTVEEQDGDVDMSEEEALADLSTASVWQSGNTPEADLDMTYISTATLHTSKTLQEGTGLHDGADEEEGGEEEEEDVDMDEVSSLRSDELLQPIEADFSYISTGRSFTPQAEHRSSNRAASPLFEDDPVTQESFYGLPDSSTSRDKGKGKQKQGDETTTQKESFYPSSPPLRVVIPSPQKAQSIVTPAQGNKREHEDDIPDAPASKRRTNRETPNLTLVREASEIMSDALEVEESMQMIEEEFGNDFDGPPTPESQEEEDKTNEMQDDSRPYPTLPQSYVEPGQEEISYPTVDTTVDTTGIPSPTSSLPQVSPPAPTGYLARIFSPFKWTPSKPVIPAPVHAPSSAQTSSGLPRTPGGRSVHFEDETSIDARQRAADRTALVESEATGKNATEVGSSTSQLVGDATKALLEEWDRQRSDVRRQAEVVGAITIDDETESALNERSARETSPPPATLKFKKPATVASSSRTSTSTATAAGTTPRMLEKQAATATASSSRPSPPPPQAREETLIDSLLDEITTVSTAPSGLVWSKAEYRHLDLVLSSSSTSPSQATKCYKVLLDRPERILAKEVVSSLALDEKGFLVLSRKESAAVDRFMKRERTKGKEWSLVEVVRRTAGIKIAGRRRELVAKK
ncbi:hypothetical protein BZA05DRAFT_10734 [Tricharina praecox]|uniref:uncharacterized protein n=1 Tax=Tricharina praecox TaxID=43433 RepID=UPI00221FF1F4|nr:uncharacterized protein BZA05DRAFT_10734 [Tricharina praecox]KAI5858687.1 hypothetical protein BZA05DRAFT_10734 [Tricharina praecox]